MLIVDPSSLCNLRCIWCPSGHDDLIKSTGRKQCTMDFDQFCKIVDSAKSFGEKINVLRLYKEGEPLVNSYYANMVEYAKQSGCFKRIDTTTNGVLLNPKLNREIIEAGLDQINISVNGMDSDHIYKNTGRKIDFDAYVDNIRDLYEHRGNCTVYIKSIKDILSEEEKEKFFNTFGEISDRIFLEQLSPAWPCFELNDYDLVYEEIGNYGQVLEDRKVCPYLFYIMVVNADGTVSTCVQDWKHVQIVGDIKDNTLKEIWIGEKQKKYLIQHLENNRKSFEMCESCKAITHGCYDNIDKYAEQILNNLALIH